jgi:hypothetical protein
LQFFQPRDSEPAVAEVRVPVARESLETYSLVSDISAFEPFTKTASSATGLYLWDEFLDLIDKRTLVTTRAVFPGDSISRDDILPVGDRGFRPGDPELGIISIYAPTDKILGGKIRPGILIDVYGYLPESGERSADTILVATGVWVVDVHSASGEEVVRPTTESEEEGREAGGGLLPVPVEVERTIPANVLTLAADLGTVDSIIYWLGARGYSPWVIMSPLASGGEGSGVPGRTPVLPPTRVPPESPTPTPSPMLEIATATPTPTPAEIETPTEQPTPPAIGPGDFLIHMSAEEGGSAQTDYPEDTSVVYAVVSWNDAPKTAIRVRAYFATTGNWILDITDVVEGTGTKSYEIQASDEHFDAGPYLTFLYVEPGLSVLDMVWWMVDTTVAVGSPEILPETGARPSIVKHYRGK